MEDTGMAQSKIEKQLEIKSSEFFKMCLKLEQVTSIAKAAKLGVHTTYIKGLDNEEIANIFDGINELLSPVKDFLYLINEHLDTKKDMLTLP